MAPGLRARLARPRGDQDGGGPGVQVDIDERVGAIGGIGDVVLLPLPLFAQVFQPGLEDLHEAHGFRVFSRSRPDIAASQKRHAASV